jgi:hypothetical protein
MRWLRIIAESAVLSALYMCLAQFTVFAIFLDGRNADPAVTRAAWAVVFTGLPLLVVMVLLRAADQAAATPSPSDQA